MNIFKRKESESAGGRREVRFAGTWYENDSQKLAEQLDGYLREAQAEIEKGPCDSAFAVNPKPDGPLLALIAPHAGYMFSGSTAAYAYQYAKQTTKPKRVFLLGPSHYVGFQGVALSQCSSFATALGDLEVDRECVEELKRFPLFDVSDEIHQREHSLELQLAFIKHVFGDIKLVPLVVGLLQEESEISLVGQVLKRFLGPDDLIVVSSDFTHYGPRYDYMPFYNGDFPQKVKEMDQDAFGFIRDSDLSGFMSFHKKTGCTICGFYPCSLLLSILPKGSQASLLRYGTSRDTHAEDQDNSVSYLSLVLTRPDAGSAWEKPGDNSETHEGILSDEDKANLLKLARSVVTAFAKDEKIPSDAELDFELNAGLEEPRGVFVTLFKKLKSPGQGVREDKELRGCIGYIYPIKPLYQAVIDNALGASCKDYRFSPLREEELKDIELEISVLTPLRKIDSYEEIEIGKHGVVFYLRDRQSVFLPHVATEFGWNRQETLEQLSMKAGFDKNAWKHKEAKFDVFESIMFEEEDH